VPPFVHRHQVRYAECDMQGHVFNAHYLTWFDTAHTELIREAFGPYRALVDMGVELVVAEAHVRYRASARMDEHLAIEVSLAQPGQTSLTSTFAVRREADLVADGTLRHVCVDAHSFTKTPWPPALRAAFARYAGAPSSTATT
jgi:acyl-CoA thioester hydrolase